jgi:hypothetical protein
VSILIITVIERFTHGGWVTVMLTSAFVLLCYAIHRHYRKSAEGLRQLDDILSTLPQTGEARPRSLDSRAPMAVLLVGSYSGFGVHTLLSILRFFYGLLHNETSKIIQRRLQWVGVPMVVLPIRARV